MLRKAVNLVTLAHYVLMNKNTPVLSFDYDLGDHKAVRIREVFAPEAAPFGFVDRRGDISKAELNYWWRHRAIPASRAHVKRLLENLQLESTLVLAEKSFGLSLSDRYWLNDEDDPASWDAVNFFDNDFSDDLGFLTLGQDLAGSSPDAPDYRTVSLSSPNSTLGGDLLKKWKIVNGERVLLKSGVGFVNQEPYNEVAATALHRRFMEPGEFTPYTLFEDGRRVYSACPNLLGPDEELVAAGVSAFAQGTAMLAVSEETRDISGGFILKDGRIEVNCTFDALVRAEREQTAGEVAKLLFPEA